VKDVAGHPWITERAFISPWAHKKQQEVTLPASVLVYDVTLRDGEQYPGLVFTKDDKLQLAEALDELGIRRLEAGMPAVSQEDFDAIHAISKKVTADVVVFCRGIASDVDLAVDAGAWGVVVELPSNETLINVGYNWSRDDVVRRGVETCNYAKKRGLHTTFFMIDSSGAEPGFLQGLVREVLTNTDIDSLTAVDTFGRLTPAGTAAFVSALRSWSEVPIEIHVHNDFGLGTANCLAAVEAGAEVVHTNMLGLGERSGGVPTEEVVAALEFIYGVDTGVNLERLRETANVFEEISGVHMPGHKAVVGANSFTYEVGIAAMFAHRLFKKDMPLGVVPYRPELVGGQFDLALGKKAGKYNVIWELERMDRSATEEQIREMVERIKSRAIERKGPISREEFASIYDDVTGGR